MPRCWCRHLRFSGPVSHTCVAVIQQAFCLLFRPLRSCPCWIQITYQRLMTFCENALIFFCLFSLLKARSDFVYNVFLTFLAKKPERLCGYIKWQKKNPKGRELPGISLLLYQGGRWDEGHLTSCRLRQRILFLQSNRQQNTLKVKFAACSTFFKPHILPWKQSC